MAQTAPRSYKHTAPFDSGLLNVGSIHRIHYSQYGLKTGVPVIFLHGGPGGSTSPKNTIFFNPSTYRTILLDQRGCGHSLPSGEVRENSTRHLVSDIEDLRSHLGIQRWHVFGASWGSTVALLYAQSYPEKVVSLTVRGVAAVPAEGGKIDFNEAFRRTACFRPEVYEELLGGLSVEERGDVAGSYARRVEGGDLAAMRVMGKWGGVVSKLIPPDHHEDEDEDEMTEAEEKRMVASMRVECHYHAHHLWLKDMRYLETEQLEKIKDIPCAIVNGRYDLICPPSAAWYLHKALPKSKIFIIDDAGHSAAEPGIQNKLVEICDEFATLSV